MLASPQPPGIQASMLLFSSQEQSPAEKPSDQTPPQNAAQPDNHEPAAKQPEASAGPAENSSAPQAPAAQLKPESAKPTPAAPKKTTDKPLAARKPAKRHAHSKTNSIVVVHNGGRSDSQGQISSGTTVQQAPQQQKETNSLLSATASNLQKISEKDLNPNQQDMVKQIRNYMQQSKHATAAGDIQGANNLAFKAHLLSEELVKH